ncbi:MAG: tyrosine-type recombinase/integrase [Anaerolineales bacterium]|nr:tyrosine-type recombinase/integrase [Anaerolineales bacterium]
MLRFNSRQWRFLLLVVIVLDVIIAGGISYFLSRADTLAAAEAAAETHVHVHREPVGVDAIRRIIRDAFRRAGIPHGRGHALRHTVACRIVNQGGSIKEVADVLRHRSLNTSMIYGKLEHGALSGVALPWPGSAT